jgi:small subunit ribosomal protein S13
MHDINNAKGRIGIMARIKGVQLPSKKRIEYGLPYIIGIGLATSRQILTKLHIPYDKRVSELTDAESAAIEKEISSSYVVEGDLRKRNALDIKRLQEIGSYRGLRHKKSLPVRGQRTKTNARTRKDHVDLLLH